MLPLPIWGIYRSNFSNFSVVKSSQLLIFFQTLSRELIDSQQGESFIPFGYGTHGMA